MLDSTSEYPQWLVEQRQWRYRGRSSDPRFKSRRNLTRRYVDHLMEIGQPVTFEAIRSMLKYLNRDYKLGPQQISGDLTVKYARKDNPLPKMPNGCPVSIDGAAYPSARSAAEALGISPQTVLNRIASARPQWTGWTR